MPRNPKDDRFRPIALKLISETHDALDALAKKHEVSKTAIIEGLILHCRDNDDDLLEKALVTRGIHLRQTRVLRNNTNQVFEQLKELSADQIAQLLKAAESMKADKK